MPCIVVVRHQIKPGQFDIAKNRIESNGGRMAEASGFISRVLMNPHGDESELATVTSWQDRDAYLAWVDHNRKANVHRDKETPYVGSPETRIYELISQTEAK